MQVQTVPPFPHASDLLRGMTYSDAYCLHTDEQGLDAITSAKRMIERMPRWITTLMTLRNILMRPFGLKRGAQDLPKGIRRVGPFPVVSQSPERVVLGFDDTHLDFRLVVDAPGTGDIVGTTLIRTHNLLGRVYLAAVLPFHRIIVPTMLRTAGAKRPA